MKIYVLEDDPDRIVTLCRYFDRMERNLSEEQGKPVLIEDQWSQTNFRNHEFNPPYDVILLDHDLGGRQLEDHEDNGRIFLNELKDQFGNALVIIHSFNRGAAALMKQDYPPAVIATFNSVEFWSLLNAALR